MLNYNPLCVILKSRLRDNQKTKRKEETKMTRPVKPKSIKLQQQERIQELVMELVGFEVDTRDVLYNYAESLSIKSKRYICFVAQLSSEMRVLEKYSDVIGLEEVVERGEKLFEEAQKLSNVVTKEVNAIAQ